MSIKEKNKNILTITSLFILMVLLSVIISNYTKINSKLNTYFSEAQVVKENKIVFDNNSNIELSFMFKIENDNYKLQNLFQTSDYNAGIRAELGNNNDLWLLINDVNNKLLGIHISNNIQRNIWNKLNFKYSNGSILVAFNGHVISNDFTTLSPKFDNIKFGMGFDSTRRFSGQILGSNVIFKHSKNISYSFLFLFIVLLFIIYIVAKIIKSNIGVEYIYFIKGNNIYNKNRYNNLLLLRSLAWLTVLVIHSYIVFGITFESNVHKLEFFNKDFTFLIFPSPWSGVWMFFVLSGFLMGKGFISLRYGLSSNGIAKFYRNRVIQIFPIYMFSILILSIFVHPEIFQVSNLEYLFRLLTFTNDSELPININGALWTLSTEIQFYILAPFLVIVVDYSVKRIGLVYALLLIVCVGVLERYTLYSIAGIDFANWNKYIYKPLFSNLDLFLVGILANLMIDKVLDKNHIKYFKFPIFFSIGLISLIYLNSYVGYETFILHNETLSKLFMFIMPTITAVFMLYLIVYIEVKDVLNRVITLKMNIMHYFGILTFPIYIWHEPILFQVNKILTADTPFLYKVLFALLLISIIAIMTYQFIEKPMGKMKNDK